MLDVAHPSSGYLTLPLLPAKGTFGDKIDGEHPYYWWFAFNQVKGLPEDLLEGKAGVLQELVFHYDARCGGDFLLPGAGAKFAQGILVHRQELEARDGQAARDHEPQARGRRIHRALVQLSPGERAGEQAETGPGVGAIESRAGLA